MNAKEYTEEYNEGVFAFEDGKNHSDNPYLEMEDMTIHGSKKELWLEGFNDAYMENEAEIHGWNK